MFEALANPPSPSYQSVKLPASLVSAAKESAQTFRRSISGQIEYWAALGKNMESQGLTALQAKQAMEQGDRETQLQSLISKIKTSSQNGDLSTAIQSVIAENRQKAVALGNA
jgi:Asp-tRNA(Asn)/Glu-tRNA(Gln) amidotransferase B subunit